MSLNLHLIYTKDKDILPRSGHKMVVDEKYLYVLGGYVERNRIRNNHEVRGEIWRYHFVYQKWEKCTFDEEIFTLGASHSAVKIGECIFVTGGTGYPFGVNILDGLIVVNMRKMTQRMFQFIPKNGLSVNLPISTYGHTMTYVLMNKTPFLFIIGGTTGETYHQEVYQINLITLESELVSDSHTKDCPGPRYKHEAFFYRNHIYVLGGAAGTEFCYSFNQIHMFNIHTRKWTLETASVPIEVSPRCPSMSQNGQYIYVSGGYPSTEQISNVIYQFNLGDLSWSVLGDWYSPSFFHDSVYVPQFGRVFLFGGVNRILPSHKRNNDLFVFQPPTGRIARTLIDMAWEKVLSATIATMETLLERDPSNDSVISNYLLGLGVPGSMVCRTTVSDSRVSHAG